MALVKEAENTPAHFVRLADRYAVPFTAAALVIGGIAWIVSKDPSRFAQVMVVASPCPLILAAPVAIVSGMSRASRSGIIVKTGSVLEKMAHPKTMAFDKTGTITSGQLTVDHLEPAKGIDCTLLPVPRNSRHISLPVQPSLMRKHTRFRLVLPVN